MSGLLDFLNSDDARLGLSLLAAAGPQTTPMSTGQVIASGFNQFQKGRDDATDRKLRELLTRSQIDENTSQNQTRTAAIAKAAQQAELDRQFMGLPPSGATAPGPAAPAMSAGLLGAAPASGGAPAGAAPAATPVAPGAPFGGMTAAQISQRYGIPIDSVIADFKFNGGKKIAEFINDRTKPNWTTQGGNTFNTNAPGFQGGLLPQVIASPNGSVGVFTGGANPSFGLVPGSVGSVQALEETKNRSAANYQGEKVIDQDPNSPTYQQTILKPRSEVLQPQGGPTTLPGPPLGAPPARSSSPSPLSARPGEGDRAQIYAQERTQLAQAVQTAQASGDPAALARAQQDVQDLEKEIRSNRIPLPPLDGAAPAPRVPMIGPGAGRPAAGNVVDRSPAQVTANNVADATAVGQAKADIIPSADKQKALNAGNDALRTIDKALNHPGLNAGTGLQGTLDPRNYIPGTDARNFATVRDQLQGQTFLQAYAGLKGGGQITEVEGKKAEDAIARLDKAQSTDEYTSALKDLRDVVDRGLKLTRGEKVPDAPLSSNGPSGQKPKAQVFGELPPAAQFKGRSLRDTETGKTMVSDGKSWKPKE